MHKTPAVLVVEIQNCDGASSGWHATWGYFLDRTNCCWSSTLSRLTCPSERADPRNLQEVSPFVIHLYNTLQS